MKVESREYKLLVQHDPFDNRNLALKRLWEEVESAVETIPGIRAKGNLEVEDVRSICFFDTPDHTLRRNNLVLRQRSSEKSFELTLKCRADDRYLVAGTDVRPADGIEFKPKLEEDIATPFRCRFSSSASIEFERKADGPTAPRALQGAARLFPLLAKLQVNGHPCALDTPLSIVNDITVEETVWKGPRIHFGEQDDEDSVPKANVALILWSRGKQRRAASAELSFRLKDKEEGYSRDLAHAARRLYGILQNLDCAQTSGKTKTAYIYRDSSQD